MATAHVHNHNHNHGHEHEHDHDEHSSLIARPSGGATDTHNSENSANIRKLLLTCVLTLIFFVIEVIGGYLSGSLALWSDAAHMLSDSTSLIISVLALWVARQAASDTMTFGYARAEVLAAFVSVLFIWTMTGILVVQAIGRLIQPEVVDGKLMAITGLFGLFFNVMKALVLEHSHGHGEDACCAHDELEHASSGLEENGTGFLSKLIARLTGADIENPAVRAAFLCVVTDSLQNVGVILAGLAIMRNSKWTFVDPCVTFVFSFVVILATKELGRTTLKILMEGTPPNLSVRNIRKRLLEIQSVIRVDQLRAWSITMQRTALTAHITKENSASEAQVLKEAQHILRHEFKIDLTTVQIDVEGSAV